MEIEDLITPARVMPRLKATSKKHVLQELAKRAAELTGLHERHGRRSAVVPAHTVCRRAI